MPGHGASWTTLVKITLKTCLTHLSTVYPIGKVIRTMNMFLKQLLTQTTPLHRCSKGILIFFASGASVAPVVAFLGVFLGG